MGLPTSPFPPSQFLKLARAWEISRPRQLPLLLENLALQHCLHYHKRATSEPRLRISAHQPQRLRLRCLSPKGSRPLSPLLKLLGRASALTRSLNLRGTTELAVCLPAPSPSASRNPLDVRKPQRKSRRAPSTLPHQACSTAAARASLLASALQTASTALDHRPRVVVRRHRTHIPLRPLPTTNLPTA